MKNVKIAMYEASTKDETESYMIIKQVDFLYKNERKTVRLNWYQKKVKQKPEIFIHLLVSYELCNFLNAITCLKILVNI